MCVENHLLKHEIVKKIIYIFLRFEVVKIISTCVQYKDYNIGRTNNQCSVQLFGLWSSRSWATVDQVQEVVADPLPNWFCVIDT